VVLIGVRHIDRMGLIGVCHIYGVGLIGVCHIDRVGLIHIIGGVNRCHMRGGPTVDGS
jgi:hypothetical protein